MQAHDIRIFQQPFERHIVHAEPNAGRVFVLVPVRRFQKALIIGPATADQNLHSLLHIKKSLLMLLLALFMIVDYRGNEGPLRIPHPQVFRAVPD